MEQPNKGLEIPPEVISKLKAEHGGLRLLGNDDGCAIFRCPTTQEWQRFLDQMAEPETKAAAVKQLVIDCCVYPPEAQFFALIERKPGIVNAFGGDVIEFAGMKRLQTRKDL
jgi:hypothetical protein